MSVLVGVLVGVAVAVGVSDGTDGVLVAKAAGRGVFVPGSVIWMFGSVALAGKISAAERANRTVSGSRANRCMNSSIISSDVGAPAGHDGQVYARFGRLDRGIFGPTGL